MLLLYVLTVFAVVPAPGALQEAMEEYVVDHPEYKPKPNKSFLNKYEQKIKDKNEGKPEKPPP